MSFPSNLTNNLRNYYFSPIEIEFIRAPNLHSLDSKKFTPQDKLNAALGKRYCEKNIDKAIEIISRITNPILHDMLLLDFYAAGEKVNIDADLSKFRLDIVKDVLHLISASKDNPKQAIPHIAQISNVALRCDIFCELLKRNDISDEEIDLIYSLQEKV